MNAFHGDKKIKKKYIDRVKAHRLADNLIRGQGWTNGKGCAVGCTLEAYDHSRYETELGIPQWLARVEDKLFEGMPEKKSRMWPEKFLQAIKPGVNLEPVKDKFLLVVLKSALQSFDYKKYPKSKQAIEDCIKLWKLKDIGSDKFIAAAKVVRANAAAAYSAAAAAAAAAAARIKKYDYLSNELLKILKAVKK